MVITIQPIKGRDGVTFAVLEDGNLRRIFQSADDARYIAEVYASNPGKSDSDLKRYFDVLD